MDNIITMNDIVDAISIKINNIFNQDKKVYHIYDTKSKQGFENPCFFIKLLNGSISQFIGNRYDNKLYFDIQGFVIDENDRELRNMADSLQNLEYIKLLNNDLLNARKMRYEFKDGVLHFFVDYSFIGKKVEIPIDAMEKLSINGEVKSDEEK